MKKDMKRNLENEKGGKTVNLTEKPIVLEGAPDFCPISSLRLPLAALVVGSTLFSPTSNETKRGKKTKVMAACLDVKLRLERIL